MLYFMQMKRGSRRQRLLATFCLLSLVGVFFLQTPVVYATENISIPKSDLTKLLTGSSPAVTKAETVCAINVGVYFLMKALNEVVDDAKEPSPLLASVTGAVSAIGRGSQAAQADYFKSTCITPIEKAVAQEIIKSISQKSAAWISNGLSTAGGSIFPHDVTSIFAQMQQQALSSFTSTFAFDATKYPFGKETVKDIITDTQTTPEKDLQYNLDKSVDTESPGSTAKDFDSDFSKGSWAAFDASLDPNNNPIGFKLAASDILSNKIADKNGLPPGGQDIKDQIQRNGGFLDVRKCADPSTYDPSTSPGLVANAQAIINDQSGDYSDEDKTAAKDTIDKNTCKTWQTTTPGSVAANQLNQTLGSPIRQLESANNLSAILTSIFDAEVNQLLVKGLSSLDPTTINSQTKNNSSTTNNTTTNDTKQWYDANPGFNILTDIPNIIDIETKYVDVLGKQVDTLKKTIPAVYQLDLCIPGPRPNWDLDASTKIATYLSNLGDPACTSFTTHKVLGITTSTDDNGPCGAMKDATGLDAEADPIKKTDTFSKALQAIFDRYKQIMKDNYGPAYLPSEASQAKKEYEKITVFQQQISQAQDDVSSSKGTIHAMQVIKTRLDALPATTDPTYNDKLTALKATFDRTTEDLHTQVDLDTATSMLGHMQDELTTISGKDTGLIDQCYKETSDPAYSASLPVTRLPYPKESGVDDSRITYAKTFLPDFTFGDGTGKTLKVDDLLTPYHGSSDFMAQKVTFSVFENFLGIY